MTGKFICSIYFLIFCNIGFTHILDSTRRVDWTLAGLRDTSTVGFIELVMKAKGMMGDGMTPNDLAG